LQITRLVFIIKDMSTNVSVLDKLFGSNDRVKIMRFFLIHLGMIFSAENVADRCKVDLRIVKKEIGFLKGIDLIQSKSTTVDSFVKLKNGKIKNKKQKVNGYQLNDLFPLLVPLKNLVVKAFPLDKEKLIKTLRGAGKLQLVILSGVFIQEDDSRVDLLLVADGIKKRALDKVLEKVEAEIGRTFTYSAFDAKEFLYRYGMSDRFVRDVLDYPHEKIFNKLEI